VNRLRRKAVGLKCINDIRIKLGVPRELAIEVMQSVMAIDFVDQLKENASDGLALPLSAKSDIKRSSPDTLPVAAARRRR
jgi:hypothetical protein